MLLQEVNLAWNVPKPNKNKNIGKNKRAGASPKRARLPSESMTVYVRAPVPTVPFPEKKARKPKRKLDPTRRISTPFFRAYKPANTHNGSKNNKIVSFGAKGEKRQWKALKKWLDKNPNVYAPLPKKTTKTKRAPRKKTSTKPAKNPRRANKM